MGKICPTPALHSPQKLSRRSLLKLGLAASLVSYGLPRSDAIFARSTGLWTPRQTEGPFYPIHEQADKDVDLTRIDGQSQSAQGEVVRVQGRVLDTEGNSLHNVFVEIWQANTWGRYRHKRDPNTAPIDPNFQGWGQTNTDTDGRYGFKTILPGAYPAGPGWTRPPHIHFKVAGDGFDALTTQMYFPGQKLNEEDLILQNLPAVQRDMVIAKRQTATPESNGEDHPPVFIFDIVLRRTS